MTSSILAGAARGLRKINQTARILSKRFCIDTLTRYFRKYYAIGISPKHIELLLITPTNIHWTPEETVEIVLTAEHRAFGDPMDLSLRHHGQRFYNPTGADINVGPMGLPDENGKLIQLLAPGGDITIPEFMLLGGKFSTLNGVAPQLKRINPNPRFEVNLDLCPQTYTEWIEYAPNLPTECCKSLPVWSDSKQRVICFKCREKFNVYS